MDWLYDDARAAFRLIARRPGYSLLAVLTLAVGLGVNTVAFSAVNALLFRHSRMARGEEIGWLFIGTRAQPLADASLPVFERVQRESTTLQSVAAEGRIALAYETGAQTDQIWALVVSPDYFSTVHVPLAFGRTWRADETAPDTLVVLGYTPERSRQLVSQLREQLTMLPGVQEVGVADRLPFFVGSNRTRAVSIDGRDCRVSRCPDADTYAVDEQFFRAMRIPIRTGRTFTRDDGADAVVVSETMAAQFWPGRSPLGQVFREGPDARLRQVVGVVADVTQHSFNEVTRPHVYETLRETTDAGRGAS
jgi:hypothetical protein